MTIKKRENFRKIGFLTQIFLFTYDKERHRNSTVAFKNNEKFMFIGLIADLIKHK